MTQNNTINKLEQIRQALAETLSCVTGFNITPKDKILATINNAEKTLATLDTLIADCSAVDVEALEEAVAEYDKDGWNLHDETLAVLVKAARAQLELMKGKE